MYEAKLDFRACVQNLNLFLTTNSRTASEACAAGCDCEILEVTHHTLDIEKAAGLNIWFLIWTSLLSSNASTFLHPQSGSASFL